MTGSDYQTFLVRYNAQEGHQIIPVVQRLTDSHYHQMGHLCPRLMPVQIFLDLHHLSGQFSGVQVPLLGHRAAGAEAASDIAAHLCGDTDG
ncbi:hypothetical protein D3C75_1133920 [compost metagenome]